MTKEEFRVLTLNCWGVFIPSWTVRKDDRLFSIAERLIDGTYDVILLQEIWTDEDFSKLRDVLDHIYPHSIYFHCHVIGSGMCIFSKWSIDNTLMHSYAVNGYPQFVHQADWYCGKGIGLARLTTPTGFRVNFYVTHLIARYALDRKMDRYESHRTSQLIELLQFIRSTADSADAIIIGGDFNLESNTPEIAFFKSYLGVSDAWLNSHARFSIRGSSIQVPEDRLEIEGCTCDRADNPYRNDEWTRFYGNGERLDYIFFRTGSGPFDPEISPTSVQLTCDSCWLDMREVTGDSNGLHYSDHEGVGAHFTLRRLSSSDKYEKHKTDELCTNEMEVVLRELSEKIDRGLFQCRQGRILYTVCSVVISLLLIFLLRYAPYRHWFLVLLALVLAIVLSPAWFMLLWGSLVGRTAERRALNNSQTIIRILKTQLKTALTSNQVSSPQANGNYMALSD